jgi:hypothetical protein
VVPFRRKPVVHSFETYEALMEHVQGMADRGGSELDMMKAFAFNGACLDVVVAPAKVVRVGRVERTVVGKPLPRNMLGGLPCDSP